MGEVKTMDLLTAASDSDIDESSIYDKSVGESGNICDKSVGESDNIHDKSVGEV